MVLQNNHNSNITDEQNKHSNNEKFWNVVTKMWHRDSKWANGTNRLAGRRVATKLQFMKNTFSAKHNKPRSACIVMCLLGTKYCSRFILIHLIFTTLVLAHFTDKKTKARFLIMWPWRLNGRGRTWMQSVSTRVLAVNSWAIPAMFPTGWSPYQAQGPSRTCHNWNSQSLW